MGVLVGNCVVDAGVHDVVLSVGVSGAVCGVVYVVGTSPRPISTGRLGITAVHLRPINPVFCWGP